MEEVYILERFLGPGIWEIVDTFFFETYEEAKKELREYMKSMEQFKKDPTARITKLKKVKK